MSLKEQILKADDLPKEKVNVPEWNVDVYVRALTAAERDGYEASLIQWSGSGRNQRAVPTLANAKAKLVALTMITESGERVFDDAAELGKKSASAINRLYEVAQRLSGISDEDVQELVKNSKDGQDEDSPSD